MTVHLTYGIHIPDDVRYLVTTRDRYRCVRCSCPALPGELHHRRSRLVKDGHRHCPCTLVLLCATCHRWVHAHPLEARAVGLIMSKFEELPGATPVQVDGAQRWTLCDGSLKFSD